MCKRKSLHHLISCDVQFLLVPFAEENGISLHQRTQISAFGRRSCWNTFVNETSRIQSQFKFLLWFIIFHLLRNWSWQIILAIQKVLIACAISKKIKMIQLLSIFIFRIISNTTSITRWIITFKPLILSIRWCHQHQVGWIQTHWLTYHLHIGRSHIVFLCLQLPTVHCILVDCIQFLLLLNQFFWFWSYEIVAVCECWTVDVFRTLEKFQV